jgi:hypothetical protein
LSRDDFDRLDLGMLTLLVRLETSLLAAASSGRASSALNQNPIQTGFVGSPRSNRTHTPSPRRSSMKKPAPRDLPKVAVLGRFRPR